MMTDWLLSIQSSKLQVFIRIAVSHLWGLSSWVVVEVERVMVMGREQERGTETVWARARVKEKAMALVMTARVQAKTDVQGC